MKKKVTVGMIDPPKLKTLEEIEARRAFARFQAETIAEYEGYLRTLDDADIRSHASVVGVRPSNERRKLELTLLSYFKNAKAELSRYDNSGPVFPKHVVSRMDDYDVFMRAYQDSK